MKHLVDKLARGHSLDAHEYHKLIQDCDESTFDYLRSEAVAMSVKRFGTGIYVRGLIEVSSFCRNNCRYCGLRSENNAGERYRLSDDEILSCCERGYGAGLRTFVLQGGEDGAFTDERLVSLVRRIKEKYSDAAITLSMGERTKESYERLFAAGASRYLLRHEAASQELYGYLHPQNMSLQNRLLCIENLKAIGYQVGMGMIIGVPGQTVEHLVEDLLLMKEYNPHKIGIGPFIPHRETPFASASPGDLRQTLILLSIVRLMFPDALVPATTALSTLDAEGRKQGVLSGANVVMPNLSPADVRDKYSIYDNKRATGAESVECINLLERELSSIGYHIDYSRGDYKIYGNE